MIDTDKYEGHTPAPWTIDIHKVGEDTSAIVIESNMTTHSNCVLAEVEVENRYAKTDAQLIADAPLLLAEVKRLRERNDRLCEDLKRTRRWIQKQVQPLKILAGQADLVACTAEKELLNEFMGDD